MLALYGSDMEKVFVWKKFKTNLGYVEFVESESELIEKFKAAVESYHPDIITGYFSDGFDLPYIKTRANKYKIKEIKAEIELYLIFIGTCLNIREVKAIREISRYYIRAVAFYC